MTVSSFGGLLDGFPHKKHKLPPPPKKASRRFAIFFQRRRCYQALEAVALLVACRGLALVGGFRFLFKALAEGR